MTVPCCTAPPQERYSTAVHIVCDLADTPYVEKVVGSKDACHLEVFVNSMAGCYSAAGHQRPAAVLVLAALLLATLLAALF